MNLHEKLTPRELEVLKLLLTDHSPAAIASQLSISRSTVGVHRRNIKLKTGIGLFALMGIAREQGIFQ